MTESLKSPSAGDAGSPLDLDTAHWFFQNSLDLFLVTDRAGKVLQLNPAWQRTLGWEAAELMAKPAHTLIHPDDMDMMRAAGEEAKREGSSRRTFRIAAKAGGWRWIDGLSQAMTGERLMIVMRDVTEMREREEERTRLRTYARLLTDSAGVVTWTMDGAANRFTPSYDMPRHLDPAGRKSVELDRMAENIHPDDEQTTAEILRRGILEGVPGAYETRIRGADGRWETRRINFTCEPRPGYYLLHGLSQDITGIVAARDAARDAEREARALLEGAPFGAVLLDTDLTYVSANQAWRALFPNAPEFEGRKFGGKVAPTAYRWLKRMMMRALAGETVHRPEKRIILSDETEKVLRWQARPWRTSTGEIRGVVVYALDITDMVADRRAARANARRLKLALDSANATVFEVDYANKTFWAAPGFHKLAGRTLTYEESLSVWPTIHPEDQARISAQVDAFNTHAPKPIEARLMTADGPRWTRSHIKTTHDSVGRPRKSTGLVLDIDASKRQTINLADAERRANAATEAHSQFLANISHEVRTPMNGVLGVLQLIKREHLDSEELSLLDEALASGRMLSEMLDDLLDYSKIETGQFELHTEPLDPSAVLVGVAGLLQPVASAKGLTMSAFAAPDLGMINADPLRLRQALYNLMGNAVKFTPSGSIEARLTRVDGGNLRFEIQDTGIGVAESAQATLFERFEQADGSMTRQYGGTGLGLAITKRLAEMMGGSVGFSSRPGEGSTFWIEIDGTSIEAPANDVTEPDIGAFKVLLVEDNPTNRLVISKILEALGVVVETACDGAEGVQKAETGAYDLVLMDIQMPGMDGIEATKRIRAMEGLKGAMPILAITANVMADQRTSYQDAGMDGVVAKPVSAAALLAEIARVTDRAA